MFDTQLRANIYGIGQLITQRKLFSVPEHQRSFSWTTDEVDQFLTDISSAIERESSDYFVGLIVMQGQRNDTWVVLDGQQRLATVTIIYSAMRDWLRSNEFEGDAMQLEAEFIGVRRLGGDHKSRLRLNSENRQFFDEFVVEVKSNDELLLARSESAKGSSNWLILDSLLYCREWVKNYCSTQSSIKAAAQKLFKLSGYFETGVNVIGVDVSSETDAYVLFESLNDRGLKLSSLDLVKNYVFSFSNSDNLNYFQMNWANVAKNIEGKNADEFLKVFWTSRFGLISKLELFDKMKRTFSDTMLVTTLVRDLSDASEKLNAIADPEDKLWQNYDPEIRSLLFHLQLLGSKQVRPVILSALDRLSKEELTGLLWLLIVAIVRFQLIGRGRTGIMEKNLGRLAVSIWSGRVTTANQAAITIQEILLNDELFEAAFRSSAGLKGSRLAYVLACLEEEHSTLQNVGATGGSWREYMQDSAVHMILKPINDAPDDHSFDPFSVIGNFALLENELSIQVKKGEILAERLDLIEASNFMLTREVLPVNHLDTDFIQMRSSRLAELATSFWKLPVDSD